MFRGIETEITHVRGAVEAQILVERGDAVQIVFGQIERADIQVLRQAGGVVALGDDGDVALGGHRQPQFGGPYGAYGYGGPSVTFGFGGGRGW